MPKRFTLAQAQSLIPRVDRLLREAIALKSGFTPLSASNSVTVLPVPNPPGMML